MRARLVGAALLVALVCLPTWATGGAGSNHGSVTCLTTATQIRPADPSRRSLIVYNTTSATTIELGANTPTALTYGNGIPLTGGSSKSFSGADGFTGAYFCITSSGTVDLRWEETY